MPERRMTERQLMIHLQKEKQEAEAAARSPVQEQPAPEKETTSKNTTSKRTMRKSKTSKQQTLQERKLEAREKAKAQKQTEEGEPDTHSDHDGETKERRSVGKSKESDEEDGSEHGGFQKEEWMDEDNNDDDDEKLPSRPTKRLRRQRGTDDKDDQEAVAKVPKASEVPKKKNQVPRRDPVDAAPSSNLLSQTSKPAPSSLIASMKPAESSTRPSTAGPSLSHSSRVASRMARAGPPPPQQQSLPAKSQWQEVLEPGETSTVTRLNTSPVPPDPQPSQAVEQVQSKSSRKVMKTLEDLIAKLQRDTDGQFSIDLSSGIDLGGSFQSETEKYDFFDRNKKDEIILQPRIPIFPEDFPPGKDEWPLSWWGIVDPVLSELREERDVQDPSAATAAATHTSSAPLPPTGPRPRYGEPPPPHPPGNWPPRPPYDGGGPPAFRDDWGPPPTRGGRPWEPDHPPPAPRGGWRGPPFPPHPAGRPGGPPFPRGPPPPEDHRWRG